jgi:hypothetical protein
MVLFVHQLMTCSSRRNSAIGISGVLRRTDFNGIAVMKMIAKHAPDF